MMMNILLTIGAFTVPIMIFFLILAFVTVLVDGEPSDRFKTIVVWFVNMMLFNILLGCTMLATLVWM